MLQSCGHPSPCLLGHTGHHPDLRVWGQFLLVSLSDSEHPLGRVWSYLHPGVHAPDEGPALSHASCLLSRSFCPLPHLSSISPNFWCPRAGHFIQSGSIGPGRRHGSTAQSRLQPRWSLALPRTQR